MNDNIVMENSVAGSEVNSYAEKIDRRQLPKTGDNENGLYLTRLNILW